MGKNSCCHMLGATGAHSACRARRLKATFSLWEAQTRQGCVSRRHYSLLFWHRGDCSSVRISGIRRSEGEPSQGASRGKVGLPPASLRHRAPGWCCTGEGWAPSDRLLSVKPSCKDSSPQHASCLHLVHLIAQVWGCLAALLGITAAE